LLNFTKEHKKARELEIVKRYRMPQDIKDYQMQYEVDMEKAPITKRQKWEDKQMPLAVFKFGAKNQERKRYESFIDNKIEFLEVAHIPGTNVCCLIFNFFKMIYI